MVVPSKTSVVGGLRQMSVPGRATRVKVFVGGIVAGGESLGVRTGITGLQHRGG